MILLIEKWPVSTRSVILRLLLKTINVLQGNILRHGPASNLPKGGDFYAYCDICSCDFSIKHSGRYDVKVHINTGKHQGNTEKKSSNHSILNFIESTKCKDDSSINAECLMANFIIEHNLPIAISDHLSPLVKKMFPDSKIAKQFACKRTKTTQIIHEMASDCQSDMSGIIEDSVFSISTDGSSDRGCEHQLYPMVIRYYDKNAGKILTGLLSLPSCEGASTGENIFQLMDWSFAFQIQPLVFPQSRSENMSIVDLSKYCLILSAASINFFK